MILNQNKQQGMTFIGIVIMFLFIGFLLLALLRVFPLYYENMGVQSSIEGFATEYESTPGGMSISDMRKSLQRRFDVQEITNLKAKDIKIKSVKGAYRLDASYHPVVNYIGNVNFMIDFEHIVELKK